MGGIGEEVVSAGTLPSAHILLVNPGIATPTPAGLQGAAGRLLDGRALGPAAGQCAERSPRR